jgi:TonB family protein
MIDPVSAELIERSHDSLPWRRALVGAVTIHVLAAIVLLASSQHRSRPLLLPKVQVRIGALPVAAASVASAPPAALAPTAAKPVPKPTVKASDRAVHEPEKPARHTVAAAKAAPETKPQAEPAGEPTTSDEAAQAGSGHQSGGLTSPTGVVGLGSGTAGIDEPFPYAYYLNRLLGLIESNWFRPDVPAGTRCRLRCRIDRFGVLLEAGIEEPSPYPAFDRAALRSVYASAPFPSLPQGYSHAALTLHMEFGP